MRGLGLVASALLGCGGELVGGGATSEGTMGDGSSVGAAGSMSQSVGSDGMSGAAASESGADASTSSDSGTTIDTCGDGTVDPDEECDDGNRVDGDACSSGCDTTFDVVWTVSHDDGAGGTEHAYAVVVDTEGIYVLGDEDPLSAPVRRLWLQKYAHDGTPGWALTFAGPNALGASGRGLARMPDGDLAIVGRVRVSSAEYDLLVMRVDPVAQSIVWTNSFDATEMALDDDAEAVAVDPDGNLLVTGGVERFQFGFTDAWVGGFTPDGLLQWSQTWNVGFDAASGDALALRGDGTIEVIAYVSNGFSTPSSQLVAFDPSGAPPQASEFGGAVIHDLDPLADGGHLAAGHIDIEMIAGWRFDPTWSEASMITGPPGTTYAVGHDRRGRIVLAGGADSGPSRSRWVGGFDAKGAPLWADSAAESRLPSVWTDLAVDAVGDVVVVGWENTSGASSDAVIRKYHPH